MFTYYKLSKPKKSYPKGVRATMFKHGKCVLIRMNKKVVELFYQYKVNKKEGWQELKSVYLDVLPDGAKRIPAAKFKYLTNM